jgi:hypothetical protein
MLEAYTTLAFVAARTKRIRLAVLVTGVMHRHPGVLAKTVTTLDVLRGAVPYSDSAPPGTTANNVGSECRSYR